jgi:hypothetical protein
MLKISFSWLIRGLRNYRSVIIPFLSWHRGSERDQKGTTCSIERTQKREEVLIQSEEDLWLACAGVMMSLQVGGRNLN